MNKAWITEIISPLWNTKLLILAVRLYDRRPCHKISILIALNCVIEKSAAKLAYFPSFPSIPIPTCAAYIIPTSFPPSPIEQILLFVNFYKLSTISVFYVGDTRQQTTLDAFEAD